MPLIATSVLILGQVIALYTIDFVQKRLIADPQAPGGLAPIPTGFNQHLEDGLPLGVQLVGRPADEATLLALSAQIETARPWSHRRPPVS